MEADKLIKIGQALTSETNIDRLLELILNNALDLCCADAGVIQMMDEYGKSLTVNILMCRSLGLHLGGSTGQVVPIEPIQLYIDNKPNLTMITPNTVFNRQTINVKNINTDTQYDFSGTFKLAEQLNYEMKSFLSVPLKDPNGDVMAVLQLINHIPVAADKKPIKSAKNKKSTKNKEVNSPRIWFGKKDIELAESLASQASIVLHNKMLANDMKVLFEDFIELIADAIDEKSPYTGGHCHRVPEITMMLATEVNKSNLGSLADFSLDEAGMYELHIASYLHDCGKVATPEYIIDKPKKLSTIFDRIELIKLRYEILKRDQEIALLRQYVNQVKDTNKPHHLHIIDRDLKQLNASIEDELDFINQINYGSEYMTDDHVSQISDIATKTVKVGNEIEQIINSDELYNLSIRRGTLTKEERQTINNHINVTISMLNSLHYPRFLKNVPEYAGGHHERIDGKGYPNGLTKEKMSVPARMLAIADIFEALTAQDRPYKDAKRLSESLDIMNKMASTGHIDPELFQVFIESRVWLQYARKFLNANQLDISSYEIKNK